MRVRGLILLLALGMICLSPAFAAKTILYYDSECCRNITEGEFAILYCQALNLREPIQGWTVQTAAAALSTLGHQPEGGWVLSRFLSEAAMSRLLRNSKLYRKPFNQPDFQTSNKPVTIANARNAVPSDDAITQGEFALLLARALNLPSPAHPTPETAIKLLSSRTVPLKPISGWSMDAPLTESEMLEVLSPTPFRASSVDPTSDISALQVYSLLFGKFEIATQGHFGLYIVEALGIPPPSGKWTMKGALDYVGREFGVSGDYGLHRNAPLCAEFFVNSLRQILLKLWQPANTPPTAKRASALFRILRKASDPILSTTTGNISFSAAVASDPYIDNSHGSFEFTPQQGGKSAGASLKDVDAFIKDVRSSGLLPTNQCLPVAAQGFSKSAQGPIGPVAAPAPPPPEAPKSTPPASASSPPPEEPRQ
jgi:hypothetical protein